MTNDLVARVREALRLIIDPELGHNIVDLGFVYEITAEDGAVRIVMMTTTKGCPAAGFLKEGVAASAAEVEGVHSVDVVMTFEPPWAPSMIDPATRPSLGFASVQ
jgi:metal-sulfur cluster biosynthetic enzyme